jgi:hypothetical protein
VKCGGEAKPAREAGGRARGARPGGGLVEGTMDRGPSGREAARGSPSTRGEDMAILLIRQFAEGGGGHLGGPLAGVSAPAR